MYFVTFALYVFKKFVDSVFAVPEYIFLLVSEFDVWFVYRKFFEVGTDKFVFESAHLRTVPASYRIVKNRQIFRRHHQIFVDAHHASYALTHGARSNRIVECKGVNAWLFKLDAVGFEPCAKTFAHCFVALNLYHTVAVALVKCSLNAVAHSAHSVGTGAAFKSIYQ